MEGRDSSRCSFDTAVLARGMDYQKGWTMRRPVLLTLNQIIWCHRIVWLSMVGTRLGSRSGDTLYLARRKVSRFHYLFIQLSGMQRCLQTGTDGIRRTVGMTTRSSKNMTGSLHCSMDLRFEQDCETNIAMDMPTPRSAENTSAFNQARRTD